MQIFLIEFKGKLIYASLIYPCIPVQYNFTLTILNSWRPLQLHNNNNNIYHSHANINEMPIERHEREERERENKFLWFIQRVVLRWDREMAPKDLLCLWKSSHLVIVKFSFTIS